MSPRIRNLALVFILCLAAPRGVAPAQTARPSPAPQPKPINLTGAWVDARHNRTFQIEQTGNLLELRTQAGAVFEGDISGRSIELMHDLTFAETSKKLPLPVRRQITGERVAITGTLSEDGETIQGEFITHNPRWEHSEETGKYVIKEMREARTPFTLTRPMDIHIERIRVDYEAARQHMQEIREQLYEVNTELHAVQPLRAEAEQRYRAALARAEQTRQALRNAKIRLAAAQPNPDLSLQIEYLEALRFFQQLQDALGPNAGGNNPKLRKELRDAVEQKNALKKQLRAKGFHPPLEYQRTNEQLQAMIHNLERRKRAARQRAGAPEDAYWEARKADVHAESDLDLALHSLDYENAQEFPLQVKKQLLESQSQNARKLGDPLLTAVEITDSAGQVYQAHWKDPKEALDEMAEALRELDTQIGEDRENADKLHEAYQDAIREELDAADRVPSAIYKSAFAQYGIEVADLVQETLRNAVKAKNPYAAILATVGEKFLEVGQEMAWAKGSFSERFKEVGDYQFVDESKIREEMMREGEAETSETAEERHKMEEILLKKAANAGVVDLAKGMEKEGKVLAKKSINALKAKTPTNILESSGFRTLMKFMKKQSKLAQQVLRYEGVHAAGETGKEALEEIFKTKNASEIVTSAAKEYLKVKGKEALAEHIEGDAWKELFAAEFNRIALHQQWAAATIRVRGLSRIRAKYQFARDEVLREYVNNETYYEASETRPLKPGHDYTARLTFTGAQPTQVEVRLGELPSQGSTNTFTFHTGPSRGKLPMLVKVLKY